MSDNQDYTLSDLSKTGLRAITAVRGMEQDVLQ